MVRLSLALLALASLASTGCFGPINNRLYPADWKSKKRHPVPVYSEWTYQGEHWEHHEYVEGEGDRP